MADRAKQDEWLDNRLKHIRSLKEPTDIQRLLLTLAENPQRTEEERKQMTALVRSEKAEERAETARIAARAIVTGKAEADRRARNHRLIERGGLSDIAGLQDQDPGEHLGALLDVARVLQSQDERQVAKRAAWKIAGDALLAEREAERKAKAKTKAKTRPTDPADPVRQTGADDVGGQ